ncbi:hypothetical protein G6F32_015060 [Rhizopus arrhizus]|nr:hypothetical protein G6F32_015060 [Rhizopus arrhizus]
MQEDAYRQRGRGGRCDEDRHRQLIETGDEGDDPAADHPGQQQGQHYAAKGRPVRGAQRLRRALQRRIDAGGRRQHQAQCIRHDQDDVRDHEAHVGTRQVHRREELQKRQAQHHVRDHQRRQEQAVQHVAPGKAVARDGNRRGHRQAHRDGGLQERQPQAVLEGLHEIGVVEHGAEPAQ